MNNSQSWCQLLNNIINDPQERSRIADLLHVNPVTLTRWTSGRSKPRAEKLYSLLTAVPSQYKQELSTLLAREYPSMSKTNFTHTDMHMGIPATFYAHVLDAHTMTPPLMHTSTISKLILQQILTHLDPHEQGMLVAIMSCVPPSAGQKVHSLRMTMAQSTKGYHYPLERLEHATLFLGFESQAGEALSSAHLVLVQSTIAKLRMFSMQPVMEGSSAAYPLLLSNRTVGCLLIQAKQDHFFLPEHLDLLQNYVNLLTLAFASSDFFNLQDIELAIMPPYQEQAPLLKTFQQRVSHKIIAALREQQPPLVRTQAEKEVWQELEQELLQMALMNGNRSWSKKEVPS